MNIWLSSKYDSIKHFKITTLMPLFMSDDYFNANDILVIFGVFSLGVFSLFVFNSFC